MENFADVGAQLGLSSPDLVNVVLNTMRVVLGVAPLVALVMLIIGGFQWMVSGGDEDALARAKQTVSNALIGIVVILLAWALVSFVTKTTLNVAASNIDPSLPQ
jgi:ABC-type dipeptide/oligopeptide/nickel transport system permease subunit